MDLGCVRMGDVGARFGERPPGDLGGLFAGLPLEDDEEGPMGHLDVLLGWVGHAGPGVALRTSLRVPLAPTRQAVEVRLRSRGRYVRSLLPAYADRHGDLTVIVPAAPVVHAFLPYAALPPRARDLTVEVWLVEDGEPVEEGNWGLPLPDHETRRLENALTAVVLAMASATSAPQGAGVTPAGVHEGLTADLFALDDVGRAWAREIIADAEPESVRMIASRLLTHVAPGALGAVVGTLRPLARTPRSAAFVARLVELLEVKPQAPPRPTPAASPHLATLGLDPGATAAQVRAAFHRQAALHHPDRVPEADRAAATETMKRINEAYAALRERYASGTGGRP